ncbi:MAG: NADH-quinone oxidoreductase subunit K [Verrucomicrobiota bacterium]
MDIFLAVFVGLLAAVGTWLVVTGSLFRMLIGLAVLAQAANVLIFVSGGISGEGTGIIDKSENALGESAPDPLVQALILTAIVISFGVLAFAMTLLKKHRESEDLCRLPIEKGGES